MNADVRSGIDGVVTRTQVPKKDALDIELIASIDEEPPLEEALCIDREKASVA
jgi:hypothetical protein